MKTNFATLLFPKYFGAHFWLLLLLCCSMQGKAQEQINIGPEDWVEFNEIDNIRRVENQFAARILGTDPQIATRPLPAVRAEDIEKIEIQYSVPFGKIAQIFWSTTADAGFSGHRHNILPITGDGEMHRYTISTADLNNWQGVIQKIRFDPVQDAQKSEQFVIASFSLVLKPGITAPKENASPEERRAPGKPHAALQRRQVEADIKEVHLKLKLADAPPIPKPAPDALFTNNGMILFDGKPTFALGLGDVPALEDSFAKVKAAGFNSLIFHGLSPVLLDALKSNGLKAIFNPTMLYTEGVDMEKREKLFKQFMTGLGDRIDTIGGYFAADEPLWTDVPLDQFLEAYKILSSFEPRRAVFVNHAPRNTVEELRPYNAGADITGCDIYPVPEGSGHSDLPNQTISVVGDFVDKMFRSAGPGQPVWMFLQGYAYGGGTRKPPTYHESRFMAYNAIVHGAQGLMYYGLRHMPWPNTFWPDLVKVASELHDLSPILVAPWTGPIDAAGQKQGLEVRHKRVDGVDYIFVMNVTAGPKKLFLELEDGPKLFKVLFEDRELLPSKGIYEDVIEPYGVKIYATDELPKAAASQTGGKATSLDPLPEATGSWIWKKESQQKDNATVYFRRLFSVPGEISSGNILITADDGYRLFCNGKLVGEDVGGSQGGWLVAERYDLKPFLFPKSKNLLSIEARNQASWGGLFVELSVNGEHLLSTDGKWRVTEEAGEGWTDISYDDSSWHLATTYGAYPSEPWQRFLAPVGKE